MSNYKLHVFKPYEHGDITGRYRFVILDDDNTSGYPSNFVCILPKKIHVSSKPSAIFVQKFGLDKNFAVKLIEEALGKEQDKHVIAELQKHLNILNSNKEVTIGVLER